MAEQIPEPRRRVQKVSKNFFLHIHAPKVHPYVMNPSYTMGLGVILGFLFVIMIITGGILLLNYTPTVEHAYNSVKDIVHIVPGGRLIRNIHRLASNLMVLTVFLHLLRTFFTGSYLEGRKTNWIIGVAMFVLVLMMSFSGYLLPWDQLSYWAVTIGSNIAASARELTDLLGITEGFDLGGFMQRLLIGDDTVGQPALTRFFMLHIIFLPLAMLLLIFIHMWRIRKDGGLSIPHRVRENKEKQIFAWPMVMWAELAIFSGLLAVLILLGLFIDAPLKEMANPSFPENPAKSPWYFLGIQELVSYSAFAGGLLVPALFLGFLVSLPYIDKEEQYVGLWFSSPSGKRIAIRSAILAFITVIAQLLIMAFFGWLRDWIPGISQWLVLLFNPATLSSLVFIIYARIVLRKTSSTRMSAIAMFTMAVVALVIYTVVGIWFRGANWEFVL